MSSSLAVVNGGAAIVPVPVGMVANPQNSTTNGEMGHNGTEWDVGGQSALPIPPRPPVSPSVELVERLAMPRLTARQVRAVALLVAGHCDAGVARKLGIHRHTIARWRVENPIFKTELHRRQHDVYATLVNRVRSLATKAVKVVDAEVTRCVSGERYADPRIAFEVVRLTGVMRHLAPVGSQEVNTVAEDIVRANRGASRAGEPVSDEDRDDVIAAWSKDLERQVEPDGV